MNDFSTFKKSAIRYWERRRIHYNLALVLPALLGYSAQSRAMSGLGDWVAGLMVGLFLLVFYAVVANICFSFGYALEFHFGTDAPDSRWVRRWRPVLVVLGTMFAMYLALVGGEDIAVVAHRFQSHHH